MSSMSGYTKLFNSILASTVWSEPVETRIVWITLLAMAGKYGVAEGSVPGLAVFARLPIEAVRVALERLSAPDEDSRSKEHQGRRIAPVDGGWQILNHAKYRAQLGADERREYNRIKQAQYRKRGQTSNNVNHNKRSVDIAEAEAEAEARSKKTVRGAQGRPKAPPDPRVKAFLLWFQNEYPKRRNGAEYLVKWDRDGALVKQMLGATNEERLKKYAQVMLNEQTEDEFIVDSDRGIQILSTKFSWLSDRLAAWEAKRVNA